MVLICLLEMEKERVATHKHRREATISWKLQNLQVVLIAFGQLLLNKWHQVSSLIHPYAHTSWHFPSPFSHFFCKLLFLRPNRRRG